jgi:hypothetical protein
MTDRFGCLVPGCHLISDVDDPDTDKSIFDCVIKLYPNPASDLVNVLITETLSSDAKLHLFDFSGREIDMWQNFEKGATYMIPIHTLPSGEYFMTMTEGNKVLCSEVLLIK